MEHRVREKIVRLLRNKGGQMAWIDLINEISGDMGGVSAAHLIITKLVEEKVIDIDHTIIRLVPDS